MEEKREVVICPGPGCGKVKDVKESEEFVFRDEHTIQTMRMSRDKYSVTEYLCPDCLGNIKL